MPKIRKVGASWNFKLSVVMLLICITGFHIFEIHIYPESKIISDQVLLGVALALLGYLWLQEVKDRQAFQAKCRELLQAQKELEDANVKAIRSLALAEEAKDPYTRGHSLRVAKYSRMIGDKLGFSEEDLRVLENASILHDIGKLGIDDSVLHKKGKLSDDEWKLLRRHPDVALEILAPLEFLHKEKEIIKHHHERYDGRGYPYGVKGNEIPLGSRIIAVTDTFDAMRSSRSYRDSLSNDIIISELKTNSGSQFDPKMVNLWFEILNQNKDLLDEEI